MPKPDRRPTIASPTRDAGWSLLVGLMDRALARQTGMARGKEPPRLQVDARLRLRGVQRVPDPREP